MTQDIYEYLPQVMPGQTEGPAPNNKPRWYQPQRAVVAADTEFTFRARDIGDSWRVITLPASAGPGEIEVLIWQGARGVPSEAISLGAGGSIRIPASNQTLTVYNAGNDTVIVTAIMISDFADDCTPGERNYA